eukprot:SAG31_NODE_24583_length_478_cov_1.092348_1_plen_135_part_01
MWQGWLQQKRLFPPTRHNFWAYLAVAAALYSVQWFGWLRDKKTRESEAQDSYTRSHVVATMANMLAYEKLRRQRQLEDDQKQLQPAESGSQSADATPSSTTSAGEAEQPAQNMKAADARKLFDVLYDKVEDAPIT